MTGLFPLLEVTVQLHDRHHKKQNHQTTECKCDCNGAAAALPGVLLQACFALSIAFHLTSKAPAARCGARAPRSATQTGRRDRLAKPETGGAPRAPSSR